MKKIYLLILSVLSTITAFGQISLLDGDSIYVDTCGVEGYDVPAYNTIHNAGAMDANITFYAYVQYKPSTWFYSFCTNLSCYPVSSGYLTGNFTAPAGGDVHVHSICSPYSEGGTGIMKVVFVSAGTDTIQSYFVDSVCTPLSALSPSLLPAKVTLGPNPVINQLNLQLSEDVSQFRLEIFDILGNRQLSLRLSGNSASVDVSNLRTGMYLVRATDLNNGRVMSSTFRKS